MLVHDDWPVHHHDCYATHDWPVHHHDCYATHDCPAHHHDHDSHHHDDELRTEGRGP